MEMGSQDNPIHQHATQRKASNANFLLAAAIEDSKVNPTSDCHLNNKVTRREDGADLVEDYGEGNKVDMP